MGNVGSADTARDPRGFATKFYTDDGNWDLVGNNTPVFFMRDAMKFPDFIHTQKRLPDSNPPSNTMKMAMQIDMRMTLHLRQMPLRQVTSIVYLKPMNRLTW